MDGTTPNMNGEERKNHMLHIITTQYALKTGLKKFNEKDEAEVTKEPTQLHTK